MHSDAGYFDPNSMLWQINREVTTLFGGARALLMQAAHPLIAAGARQTGGYRRDPWARLIRTVRLQSLLTFGDRRLADEVAERINKLHKVVHGIDPVTGEWYDALDYEQLLWVHTALEVSTIGFYELTVAPLTNREKDQYHREHTRVAEMLLLPRAFVPATYAATLQYVDDMIGSGRLHITEVANEVAALITRGVVPRRIKPLWRFIAFAAVGTLDDRLRRLYGFSWAPRQQRLLDANLAAVRAGLPLLPRRFRFIVTARWADRRLRQPALTEPAAGRAASE